MAKTQTLSGKNEMTPQQAQAILNANSYINYSKDQLLEAVQVLKSDVSNAYKDLLEKFYKVYNQELETENPDYNEYGKLQSIFEGTEYAEQMQAKIVEVAKQTALNIENPNYTPESFAELDNIQALLNVVPANNQIKPARAKLNDIIIAKMESLAEGKESVSIDELPYAQHLVDNMTNNKKKEAAQKVLDSVLEDYEEENGLNKDVEVLRKNDISLGDQLDDIHLYSDGKVSDDFADLTKIVENVEITEDDGTVLDEDKKQEHLTALFEAAKLEAHQENIGSMKYLLASKKAQREQLVEKVTDLFAAKLGQAGIASTFEQPSAEEQRDDNKFKAYLNRHQEAAEAFVNELAQGSKKLQIKVKDIITACADTDVNVSRFKDVLESKIGQSKSVLGKKLNSFREKVVGLWGKRYEFTRSIVKSVKENKWQHITNLGFSTGMWLVAGLAPAAVLPAVGVYALYSAGGGYFWPLAAEAQKQRAAAKEKGEKLGFRASIKAAWQAKKKDKNYHTRAAFGILAGAAGAAVGFGGFSMGVETATARVTAGLARSLSSVSAQTTAWIFAKRDYKKDPTEENRSKLKAARTFLAVTAAGSVLAAYFSFNRLSHANIDAVTGADRGLGQLGPVKGDPADWKDHMQMSTPLREGWGELPAENTVGGVPGAAGTEAVMPSVEDSFFPEQYDAAMGISSAQYNNLLKLYSTEDLDRMYMNLNDSGVMEHMNGMTKEQFIFKWSKLDAYTDRVRWDEKAQQYISIQGAKRYHFEEEMTDLNKMLNCGDKLELAQVEKIKAALGTIDDRGGYHGPGYVPTENYHVKGAGVDGPCSEGQENHFNRGGKVTKTIQYREAVSEEAAPKSAPVSVDLNMEYGESQYKLPEYQQQMTDGVGTFEKQVEGKTHWMVSGPHGQHPIPEDAKMTMNAKTGEVLVEYSEKDGRAPEIYHKSALRKEIDTVKQTYEEPVKVAVPYTSLSEQTVNEAAELAGCKPGELTKTSVFNGTSQFRMYTEDGVVRVSVDKANVPHFSMENMDGTEATAVPTKIVEGRFKEADALLREGKYTSIPAKNEVSSQLIKSRIIARGGQGK